jgi:hypothetical protein
MTSSGPKASLRGTSVLRWILATTLILLPPLTAANLLAQESEAIHVDVTAADSVAATYSISNFHYHIFPANTVAGKAALSSRNLGTPMPATRPLRSTSLATTIAAVPAPGFYPSDLVNFGGKFLATTTPHAIFVNTSSCGGTVALCWGNPVKFLSDLSNSTFIHLTDQYVGSMANNRYAPGTTASTSIQIFPGVDNVASQTQLLAALHAAAKTLGTGYGHLYHMFLPNGMDTCFDGSSICYSPDNGATFAFCAYHASVTFSDIGHVLFSVEPYQNVLGCKAATPNPNGALADSTNSTVSHEQIEAITDPDGGTWISDSSLVTAGFEIADLCQVGNGAGQAADPEIVLNGHTYELQLEYSNKYHACAGAP